LLNLSCHKNQINLPTIYFMSKVSFSGRLWTGLFLISVLTSACSHEKKEEKQETVAVKQPIEPDSVAPEVPTEPSGPVAAPENRIATYLAGMGQPSEDYPAAWKKYSVSADTSWSRYHRSRTAILQAWAEAELPQDSAGANTLFYPFSGPDVLHAKTFFPKAKTYVLVGLEPVGSLPDTNQMKNPALLAALQRSLYSVMNFSFFRTNAMAKDLKREELDGASPLLMLFLARTGQTITAYEPLRLSKEGTFLPATDSVSKAIPGVRISFADQDGNEKELYYFSADLSDSGLGVKRSLGQFMEQFGPFTTYLKSASYLMHKSYFSQTRNLILGQSKYILQDDSGIALKYLNKSIWDFTFYGTYTKPISLFTRHFQPQLKTTYQDTVTHVKPLPFGTGYDWRKNTSNLLLLKKKAS
jgi:hypothetical protein